MGRPLGPRPWAGPGDPPRQGASDGRSPTVPGDRRAGGRFPLPAAVRVVLLSLILAVAAALLAAASPRPAALGALPPAPWWLFAGLFAVTEACVVQLRLRREA